MESSDFVVTDEASARAAVHEMDPAAGRMMDDYLLRSARSNERLQAMLRADEAARVGELEEENAELRARLGRIENRLLRLLD